MPARHVKEPLARALAGEERRVAGIMIGQQQIRRIRIGARDDHRGHAHDVRREARGDQLVDRLGGRDQHLAAQMTALFRGRQLILEMHGGGAGADQRLGQFERIEVAAETRLGIGDDRRQPIDVGLAFQVMNLIGAQQGVVDALDHFRHRVDRIQALVRIHLAGGIGIARHLPSGAINGLEARLHGLHGLVAGHAAQPATTGSLCNSRQNFSAPSRASECSIVTEPRRRATSAAL